MRQRQAHDRVARLAAARGRRTRWPARPRAAARWRARRRTAPWRGRSRAARSRRRARSRRSSACPDSPRRTCSSARCPGTRGPPRGTKFSDAIISSVRCWRSSSPTDRLGDLGIDVGQRALEVVGLQVGHPRTVATASGRRPPAAQHRSRCRSVLVRAQVDHRRRRAGQLAAVEHEIGPARGCPPGRRRAAARRPRRRGWPSSGARGRATAASGGTSGTRRPSVPGSGPQASGKRPAGLGSSSVTPPGRGASSARVRRGPGSGSAASAASRSKNITAAGLSGGRPLSA